MSTRSRTDFSSLDLHGDQSNLLLKTQVILGRDHTDSVGVTHATTPALNTNDAVALVDNSEFDTVVDTPLKTAVDIFLPDLDVEIRLGLGEIEGVDAPVQVRVSGCGFVTSDHDNGADGTILGDETSGFTTINQLADDDMGQKGYH